MFFLTVILPAVLVGFAVGALLGHAAGYGRGLRARAPRYRRVGDPQ